MADVIMSLNELHKKVYSKRKVPSLVPEIAKLQKAIPFSEKEKLGDKYVVGVRLALPAGFTHAKSDGTAGAFSLNDIKGGTQKKAEMDAYQILLRDVLSYEDAGKATQGERAFVDGVEFLYEGLQLSSRKRLESVLLYGGVGMGKVQTYTSGDPSIVISASEWAPQIWAGLEGAEIDVQSGTTSTVRATVSIVSVDIENRKLTLSATASACAANDIIYFKGAYAKEMNGIHKIVTNTSTLFGLDASTYGLWKANNLAVTGAFSFAALKKVLSKTVGKSGLYGQVDLYLNPGGWDDLQTSIEALRVTSEKDVKKVDIGAEEIVYHSQNGKTVVHSHPMVKEGYAYGLFLPSWHRVGAVDLELGAPGFGGNPWFHMPSNAGVEARIYTNQGIISEMPATNFYVSGIVNSTVP
jgi:hypothetical protein